MWSKFPFFIKPDISVYPFSTHNDMKTNSALAEMFFEVKWATDDNPFHTLFGDNQYIVKDSSKTALNTLGQITAYAAVQLGFQF